MARRRLGTLLGYLRDHAARPALDHISDADLLHRFVCRRDEPAFEELVRRHGQMLWNLCCRLLRPGPDAEDAFQATFLILVRKARSIRDGASVGGWLYCVTHRVASRLRRAAQRAAALSVDLPDPRAETDEPARRDLGAVLDEEINRLPERFRTAVVLCYLEGRSTAEAAAQIGCPRGTVLSRLATARRKLQARLLRRGVTLSVTAAAGQLAARGTRSNAAKPCDPDSAGRS